MSLRHIIRAQQFDVRLQEAIFKRADKFSFWEKMPRNQKMVQERNRGKILVNLFYQPSTRTRISFGIAAHRLGIHVEPTENAREFSSTIKGESLEDTIRVLNAYKTAVIVLRHYEEGAAERAADVSSCPIINAGDGPGQHPTQALLDLYTIRQAHGAIDGLTVVIGGDLARGRTTRSLTLLLSQYKDIRLRFIAPPELRMGRDVLNHLREHGTAFEEHDRLKDVVPDADVVYWTRTQNEYPLGVAGHGILRRGLRMVCRPLASFATRRPARQSDFCIDENVLRLMKPNATVMHPLPRNSEIAPEVDKDPRARYFKQAGNGVPIRMAAIEWVLGYL